MTATPDKYQTPYVSQMLQEPDRTYDDCAAATGLMLGGDWTLGEILERPDGRERDLTTLRNVVRKRIGDIDGGLTLHDVNDILHELDPDIADLPRYPGQKAKPGQSTAGANLRVTWDQFRQYLQSGYSAALCGRTTTGVGHVVHVTDGDKTGATLRDPLTRNGVNWKGRRASWSELRQFTERGPDRYGSPTMIACALVKVGDETEAERVERRAKRAAAVAKEKADRVVASLTTAKGAAEAALAEEKAARLLAERDRDKALGERDAFRADNAKVSAELLTVNRVLSEVTAERDQARADLAACEALPTPDCTEQLRVQRESLLSAVSGGVDALLSSLREVA